MQLSEIIFIFLQKKTFFFTYKTFIPFLAPNFRRFGSFLAPNFRRFNPFLAPNFRKISIFASDYQRVMNYEEISKKTYRQRT